MKLIELVKHQKQLQGVVSLEQIDRDRLTAALMVKCGNLAYLKTPSWCWWKYDSEGILYADRAEVVEVCADVLHFSLLLLDGYPPSSIDYWGRGFECAKGFPISSPWIEILRAQKELSGEYKGSVCHKGMYSLALGFSGMGFTQEEIEAVYLKQMQSHLEKTEAIAK